MRDQPAVKAQNSRGKRIRQPEFERATAAAPPGFWMVFGVALCATWLTYLPSLSGPFLFDDIGLPFSMPDVSAWPVTSWIRGVRPLLMASYWLNFSSSGQQPFAYHAVNLCLHALAASFAYLCAVSLLQRAGVGDSRLSILALLTAGIFLLHPLQTESVAYIAGRSEVLTGVFFFAAFAIFLRTPPGQFGYARVVAVLALSGAALLSKEHAVVLPVLLVFTGVFWKKDRIGEHVRAYAKLYGALLALALLGAVFVLRLLANAPTAGFNVAGITWRQYLLTEFRAVAVYLRLFIAPFGQNADWAFPFSHTLMERGAAIYGLAILIVIALLFYWRRRTPLLVYGLLIFFLLLSPTSSIVPIRDALAERRLYLPIFGLALATAAILVRLKVSGRLLNAAVLTVLLASCVLSYRRSQVWSDDLLFWKDVVRKSPSNLRGYSGLGRILSTRKRCAEAIDVYRQAIAVSNSQGGKETATFQAFMASGFVCNHQLARARETLRGMASSEPGATIVTELGVIAAKAGDERQAMDDFNQATRLAPNYAPAYAYRGLLELATDADAEAEKDFRRALALDSNNAFALDGLKKLAASR